MELPIHKTPSAVSVYSVATTTTVFVGLPLGAAFGLTLFQVMPAHVALAVAMIVFSIATPGPHKLYFLFGSPPQRERIFCDTLNAAPVSTANLLTVAKVGFVIMFLSVVAVLLSV